MSDSCRKFVLRQLLVAGLSYGVAVQILINRLNIFAFTYGFAMYLANLVVLSLLVDRLFRFAESANKSPGRSQKLLGMLAFFKMGFNAVSLYIGLAHLNLPPIELVSGAAFGLLMTSVVSAVGTKKMLFSSSKLR